MDVTYRKKGEQQWRKGLPLLRLQREQVSGGAPRDGGVHYFNYIAPNMFAGSLLNLEPDTEYECRFVLSDPDGVKGKAEKTVVVRTRKEPQPAEGGRVYHVYPFGYKGAKQQPAFTGLLAAYYMGSDESDHSNVMPPRVRPGDIILVHAGLYKDSRFVYSGFDRTIAAYGTPFDGTYYLTQSGTPDKPIVIKSAGDGEVIFDGDGCQNLFNLMAANYNYFEGITVRNTNVAFLLGYKNIAGSSGFTSETFAPRKYRPWRGRRLVGLEELLHRGQRLHRPPRSAKAAKLVDARGVGEIPGLSRANHIGVRR